MRPRPIRLISGASVFCETFFENVRVPAGHLVGPAEQGLDHRQAPAGTRAQRHRRHRRPQRREVRDLASEGVGQTIRRRRKTAASPIRSCATASPPTSMDAHAFQLTRRRAAEEAEAGAAPGPLSAMFKLLRHRTEQAPLRDAAGGRGLPGRSAGRAKASPPTNCVTPANGCARRPIRSRAGRPKSS